MGTPHKTPIDSTSNVPFWFSARMLTSVMTFMILCNSRSVRMNISVAILCMVNHTAVPESSDRYVFNDTVDTTPWSLWENSTAGKHGDHSPCGRDYDDPDVENRVDGPFEWTKKQQGLILSSFYWGYIVLMVPASWILNRFGTVRVMGIFSICSSASCLAIPPISFYGPHGVIVLRVLMGCFASVYDAGAKNMVSKWIPPPERARLGSLANTGSTIGSLYSFVSSGYLCKYGFADGWQSIFYIQGTFGVIVALVWCFAIHETPDVHPRISPLEKEYIQSKMVKNALSSQRHAIPWKQILTSKSVYALCMTAIAVDIYIVISGVFLPTYFAEVMKLQIMSNGIISSLPFVFQFFVQIIAGIFSDLLLTKSTWSTGSIRKLMVGIGEITCSVSLIAIGFLDCEHAAAAIVLVILSFSSIGFIIISHVVNPSDIAPQFAGVLAAITNFVSNLISMGAALFITELNSQDSSRESWQIIFTVTASLVLVTLVFYICFASGEVQPWAIVGENVAAMEVCIPFPDKETTIANNHDRTGGEDKNIIENQIHTHFNSPKA